MQVGSTPTPQELDTARTFQRSHRATVQVVSADWLHACWRQQGVAPPDEYLYTYPGTTVRLQFSW